MGALDRKLVKGWRFAAREVEALRAQRPEVGIRRALAARVRRNLELGSVPVRLAALEGALARIESDPPAAPRTTRRSASPSAPSSTRPRLAASWR